MPENRTPNDDLFEQLLADCQEEFSQAESDWKPPPGDYLTIFRGLRSGPLANDEGRSLLYVCPMFEMADPKVPQFDNRTVSWMLTNRWQSGMRAIRRTLEILVGEAITVLSDGLKAAQDQVGIVCLIRIKANPKNPDFPTCYLRSVEMRGKVEVS